MKPVDPEIWLAINDSEVLVTMLIQGYRSTLAMPIETALPLDVLAWINLLSREDGGIAV